MGQVDDRDYMTFVDGKKAKEVAREAECFWFIYQALHVPLFQVFEMFGGVGLMREVLEREGHLAPNAVYEMWDHSERCVQLLKHKYPDARVFERDSFARRTPEVEVDWCLFSADFNAFSPLRAHRERKFMRVLERLVRYEPRWIQITDSAVNRMHLNAINYTKFYGQKVTDLKSYLKATSDWFYDSFGYSIVRAAYHHGACYYLLRHDRPNVFNIHKAAL